MIYKIKYIFFILKIIYLTIKIDSPDISTILNELILIKAFEILINLNEFILIIWNSNFNNKIIYGNMKISAQLLMGETQKLKNINNQCSVQYQVSETLF